MGSYHSFPSSDDEDAAPTQSYQSNSGKQFNTSAYQSDIFEELKSKGTCLESKRGEERKAIVEQRDMVKALVSNVDSLATDICKGRMIIRHQREDLQAHRSRIARLEIDLGKQRSEIMHEREDIQAYRSRIDGLETNLDQQRSQISHQLEDLLACRSRIDGLETDLTEQRRTNTHQREALQAYRSRIASLEVQAVKQMEAFVEVVSAVQDALAAGTSEAARTEALAKVAGLRAQLGEQAFINGLTLAHKARCINLMLLPQELLSLVFRPVLLESGDAVARVCKALGGLCGEELSQPDVRSQLAARRMRSLFGPGASVSQIFDQQATAVRNHILPANSTPEQRAEALLQLAVGLGGAELRPEGQGKVTAAGLVRAAVAANDSLSVAGLLTAVPGCLPVSELNTLMCTAADSDRPAVVKALLAGGAEARAAEGPGGALLRACEGGRADVVRVLLSAGASRESLPLFALWKACLVGQAAMVDVLLEAGLPVEYICVSSSIQGRHFAVMSSLLQKSLPYPAVHLGVMAHSGWLEGLQLMLAQGDEEITSQWSKDSALRRAIDAHQVEACQLLQQAGAQLPVWYQ